jgi:hypothetical protein
MNFANVLRTFTPNILAVTEDDQFEEEKRALCEETGTSYAVLDKSEPPERFLSTTNIRRRAAIPATVPIRVDFAGGWLDVPALADPRGYIVNCAVTPGVSLDNWPYRKQAGLGGSAAYAVLNGDDPTEAELLIAGWQDAAVIEQTGLCVWIPGDRPKLSLQRDCSFLQGRMALKWTGKPHSTSELLDEPRDYRKIAAASRVAAKAAQDQDLLGLSDAISLSYLTQLEEGMDTLPNPEGCIGRKYCGSGHGGYALYLFGVSQDRDAFVQEGALAIEPYARR